MAFAIIQGIGLSGIFLAMSFIGRHWALFQALVKNIMMRNSSPCCKACQQRFWIVSGMWEFPGPSYKPQIAGIVRPPKKWIPDL